MVKGTSMGGAGKSFRPNKVDPNSPIFEYLDNWVIRFDKKTGLPFTAYPTR